MNELNTTDTTTSSIESDSTDGVLRRTVLKTGAVTLAALGLSIPVAADELRADDQSDVDGPVGFRVTELIAGPASFPDAVSTTFRMKYDGGRGTTVSNLPRDSSTVIVARVMWDVDGTSGWHTHPGPVVVGVTKGRLELVDDRDCVPRTYETGQAFVDPGQGNVHVARNSGETEAEAVATFFGVPAGSPATVWVAPADC
jgi:quercetin dioxygenase-like cupin family protein